jgi:hypothetical protein
MKTLITAVEEWIDLRIFASSKNAIFETKFNEMEKIHIRDAERIATLERRVMELSDPVDEALYLSFDELVERVDTLESEIYEVQKTTEDIPDTYSIEVMIDDAVESKVVDAVRDEIDSIDFKVTVER